MGKELQPSPPGYWTPERMAQANQNTMNGGDVGFPGGQQGGMQPAMQGGPQGMNPQQLKQMLPPAMQQGFQGNPQGLNLRSIQQQMQGGGPAPQMGFQGAGQGGGNPFRGMM